MNTAVDDTLVKPDAALDDVLIANVPPKSPAFASEEAVIKTIVGLIKVSKKSARDIACTEPDEES